MRKLFILFIFLFPLSSYSQDTNDKHPLDIWFDNCIELDGSTMGMIQCSDSAAVLWDMELNKYYNLLIGLLDGEAKEDMREAQREWIKFRDKEKTAIAGYYEFIYEKMGGGTMYPMLASGAMMEVIRKRALEIKSMYDELNIHLGNTNE